MLTLAIQLILVLSAAYLLSRAIHDMRQDRRGQ